MDPFETYQDEVPPRIIEGRDYFEETKGAEERAAWCHCPYCLRPFDISRFQYKGIMPIFCRWTQCNYSFQGDLRERDTESRDKPAEGAAPTWHDVDDEPSDSP